MTEPKLPAEPTSTSQDVLVSHEYIDYVSALREAAENALALAAEREVEIAKLNAGLEWVKKFQSLPDAELTEKLQAANARAEAMSRDARMWRTLREKRPVLLLTGFFGNGCVNRTIEHVEDAIDAMEKP